MRAFFLLFLIFGLFIASARAEQMLFKTGPQDPLHLLEPKPEQSKTVDDYANIYYKNCVAANTEPQLAEYTATQCGCTAANMSRVLTLEQITKLFDPATTDDYYYTRMMTLAYLPCLKTSVHDFLLDDCMTGTPAQTLRNKKSVCQCIAAGMVDSMSDTGNLGVIPGYKNYGFDLAKTVDDPFPYVINSPSLANGSDYYTPVCIQKKEYGWGALN